MRKIRSCGRIGAFAVAAVVGAACGGGGTGSGGLATGENYSVADALDELPASIAVDSWMISTGDLTLASELGGLDQPSDVDDLVDWLIEVTNGGPGGLDADPAVFLPVGRFAGAGDPLGTGAEEFRDEIGWSLADVDAYVEFESLPNVFTVVTGDLDADSLDDDLVEVADGVVSNSDRGDGESDLSRSSGVDRLGRPVRLAAADGRIALSPSSTSTVSAWLDGEDDTIGADDRVRAVAEQLDDQDVYAAVIVHQQDGFGLGVGAPVPAEMAEMLAERLPSEPFDTVGLGWAVDDGEPVVVVVISHVDRDAADSNSLAFAELLASGDTLQGRPLTDTFDAESVRPTGDRLVELRLRPGPEWHPGAAFRMLINRDVPFVHA